MKETTPDEINAHAEEVGRRRALLWRTLPILFIPVLATVVTALLLRSTVTLPPPPEDVELAQPFPLLPIAVLVIFCTSLIVLARLGRPTLSALGLIGAWTLVTTLGSLRYGVTSNFPALLIIPICVAGLLIDGVASVSLALLASVLVGSLAWLEVYGLGVPPPPPMPPEFLPIVPYFASGFWVGLFWTVAALTWMLAGSLQRSLEQSRAQAEALRTLSSELEARVAAQTTELLAQSREAATLEERTRLAREIHDTLAQGLIGVVVQLGAAQQAQTLAPEEAHSHLDLAQRMARELLGEARRSVWNLRAPALERGELSDALRSLAARPLPGGMVARFEERGTPWPLPPAAETALLRVCQEALVNVTKHARATEVGIVLAYRPEAVALRIEDNGIGFDEATLQEHDTPPGPWGSFGLLGMRERMSALGGRLELQNGEGAQVVAVLPRTRLEGAA